MNPLLKTKDTMINRTHFAIPFVYIMKSGHLSNKDTFFCHKGVQIREVPPYLVRFQLFVYSVVGVSGQLVYSTISNYNYYNIELMHIMHGYWLHVLGV